MTSVQMPIEKAGASLCIIYTGWFILLAAGTDNHDGGPFINLFGDRDWHDWSVLAIPVVAGIVFLVWRVGAAVPEHEIVGHHRRARVRPCRSVLLAIMGVHACITCGITAGIILYEGIHGYGVPVLGALAAVSAILGLGVYRAR